jgi:L,D-transpeptidase YcbB
MIAGAFFQGGASDMKTVRGLLVWVGIGLAGFGAWSLIKPLVTSPPSDVLAQGAAQSPPVAPPATAAPPAAQATAASTPAAPASKQATATDPAAPAEPASPVAATDETPAPDPLASLDPADRPVAEKIRDLLAASATSDRIFASKNERAAVETFYKGRSLAPLWLDKGIANARAKAVIARVKAADADGLDLNDYRLPSFDGLSPDALAEADVKLTQTVLTFARHLQAGRFPYNRVSHNNIQLPQAPPDPAAVLASMANAEDDGKALDAYAPPHEAYRRLKEKVAEIRAKSSAKVEIPDGPLLRYSAKAVMQDPRVPALREKLGLAGEASDLAYDAKLAAAVRTVQQANELPATGSLDARTVKVLNAPVGGRQVDLIVANMERWRWYPRDLGADYAIVNQPDFMLKVMHNGSQVWTTKVVIGDPSPGKQTPLLSETMKSITVNPTWNVPPSIVYGEYLPALARDPTVLARMGLVVSYGRDGSVVNIAQPPGGNSVLGRLRFNFPNRFLVYQHDTNEKFMFASEVRAFSHGCIRVQDPAKYADVLLNLARPSEHWTVERVTRMFGAGEQDLALPPGSIWVHVTYQSAFVDDAGKLQLRRDVYGVDSRTIAAIKSERAVVEPAPEGKPEQQEVASASGRRKAVAPPAMSFFESLFFGGRQAAPPRPQRGVYNR